MTPRAIISPSLLSADFGNLTAECKRVIKDGAEWLHMDVMDGHFVPNITIGAPVLAAVHKAVPECYMDCHMMVADPLRWVPDVAKAGGACYTFHMEACADPKSPQPLKIIDAIHEHGMKAGVAISPQTGSEAITDEIGHKADMFVIMTVHPGAGGQKFMPECVHKIAELRERFPEKDISVDGGVAPKTIQPCADAGSNVIVAGSAIFGAPDSGAVIRILKDVTSKALAAIQGGAQPKSPVA